MLLLVPQTAKPGVIQVTLAELDGSPPPDPDALVSIFGLTGSEARVLALIALGAAQAEVAIRLSLKTETVRGHLKAGMRNLGVRSQSRLVGCVLRALDGWRG